MFGREHRRHPRLPVQDLAVLAAAEECADTFLVENLSMGGAFLRTEQPLPAGTSLRLCLTPPGLPKPLVLDARVANTRPPALAAHAGRPAGMGVFFERLDDDARRILGRLVAQLFREQPSPPRALPPAAAGSDSESMHAPLPPSGSPREPEPPGSCEDDAVLASPVTGPHERGRAQDTTDTGTGCAPSGSEPAARSGPAFDASVADDVRLLQHIRGLLAQVETGRAGRDAELENLRRENAELRARLRQQEVELAALHTLR